MLAPTDLPFFKFSGDYLTAELIKSLDVFVLFGDSAAFFGPRSLLYLTNFTACSFVKQSHIPSHAHIMKSNSSFFIGTFLMSGYEDT